MNRMFEIATQFNAIFRTQQTSSNNTQVSVSLLSMWISRRIHSFLRIVAVQLNQMEESASLRDALDACVFFATSMGRLGADFCAQLPPLFEEKMVAIVVHHWKEGTMQLTETLKICRDAGVASPLVSTAAVVAENAAISHEAGDLSTPSLMMAPPRQLMVLPPLGRVVNAYLTGLNELRRCLLPGIFSRLRAALESDFLLEIKSILHAHERAVMTPGLRGEAVQMREISKQMKDMTKEIVFPYVRGALELSLGNEAGAKEHFDKLRAMLQPPAPPPPAVEESEQVPSVDKTTADEDDTEVTAIPPPVEGNYEKPDVNVEAEGWAEEDFEAED
jgi:hypothetical protein